MRTIAFIFGVLLSFVTWAQMPDRGGWMAGGDDGGSSLPTPAFSWYWVAPYIVFVLGMALLPARYAKWCGVLFWVWPAFPLAGVWIWATFLR